MLHCILFYSILPKNEIPALSSSSGNLGFSEAWPHPAHTAYRQENTQTVIACHKIHTFNVTLMLQRTCTGILLAMSTISSTLA